MVLVIVFLLSRHGRSDRLGGRGRHRREVVIVVVDVGLLVVVVVVVSIMVVLVFGVYMPHGLSLFGGSTVAEHELLQ